MLYFPCRQSQLIENAVCDLVNTLKANLRPQEQVNLTAEEGYSCVHPDAKHKKQRCQECQPCCYYTMLNHFTQRNTDALVKCTRLSLDAIKRRLQTSNKYKQEEKQEQPKAPLFKADIVLAIPNVVMKPSLDDIQSTLNKATQVILKMSCNITQWEHQILQQKQAQKVRTHAFILP